jgi:hypothetical protein
MAKNYTMLELKKVNALLPTFNLIKKDKEQKKLESQKQFSQSLQVLLRLIQGFLREFDPLNPQNASERNLGDIVL